MSEACERKTFVERVTKAYPFERKTRRVSDLVRLFAHAAGGRTSERLLSRLAMPVSDNAALRQLKRHAGERRDNAPLRAVAIDDWSWRKGFNYGTIIVDLQRRVVADVLETRSAKETVSIGTEVGPLIGAEKGPPRDAGFPHLVRRREGEARVELRQVRRRLVG